MLMTVFLLFTLAASGAVADEPVIRGYGGLAFGESLDKAREVFPGIEEMAVGADSALAVYTVADQSFATLRPCAATLSFIGDRFYEVKLDCGSGAEVEMALEKEFGPPTEVQDKHKVWKRRGRSVTMNLQSRGFAIFDDGLARTTQQYIMQRAMTGKLPSVKAKAQGSH